MNITPLHWKKRPQPFQDSESIRLATGNPALTPTEDCVHSWMRVSGADRFRCCHCGMVTTLEPYDFEE